MKSLTIPRFLVFISALLIVTSAQADSSGKWQNGKEVYDKVCGYCHEANVGPVLTGRSLIPDYIRAVVRNGNRAMPSFRESEIDDQALDKVALHVSTSTLRAKE